MTVHNHPPYEPICNETMTANGLKGACLMGGDERITDPALIRTYWEDDEETTRIVRRVGAALNSGRDAAVVQVVLDETETMRATLDRVRAIHTPCRSNRRP